MKCIGANFMEFRQLNIFRILAHELNFTKTAKRAHCVQSNVSIQIRTMEQELGVPLFERLGQQVRLTAHGALLLPYAERMLQLLEEANSVTKGGDHPSGTLIIGSPESVLTYRLPPVLKLFRSQHPQVDLVFRGVGTVELVTHLERGDLDLGLVIDRDLKDARLHVETICPESMVLVAHLDHPLLKRTHVDAEDLVGQTFLLTDAGCAYRTKLEHSLAQAHVETETIMEFSSVETIKQCAALGMGIACLPGLVVEQELAAKKLAVIPWTGDNLSLKTIVGWHKDKWLSPAMSAFLSLLRQELSQSAGKPNNGISGTLTRQSGGHPRSAEVAGRAVKTRQAAV